MEKQEKSLEDLINDAVNDSAREIGRVNILIAGKTGIGKSTLINSVFECNLAETGNGKPITQYSKEYSKEGSPFTLIDSKGLELENTELLLKDLNEEIAKRKTCDPNQHVHVAWYCISYEGQRIENCEIQFVKELSKSIPVIIVFTKCSTKDNSFFETVQKDIPFTTNFVKTLALPIDTPIGEIPSMGLLDLVKITSNVIPEAAQKAFITAQKVDLLAKVELAKKWVYRAATSAAVIGGTPIPFSDAILLAPLQIGMLAKITTTMGGHLSKGFLTKLIPMAAGIKGVAYVGRAIVGGLFKLIPGAGSIVGGLISGGTAAALTTALGIAYIATLEKMIKSGSDINDFGQLVSIFEQMLKASGKEIK